MLLRLVILTSAALFVGLSLTDRMETAPRVVTSGAPPVVEAQSLGTPFSTPLIVAADGTLVAELQDPEPAVLNDANVTNDAVSAVLAELGAEVEAAPVDAATAALPVQFVTADRVNLRAGPGTDNAVIGQVTFADAVSVVAVLDNGWAEIQIEGDGGSGFVAARFLADTPPG